MRCMTSCLGNIISLILVFWFVVFVVTGVWSATVWSLAFNADTYNSIEEDTYQDMSILLIPAIAEGLSEIKSGEDAEKALVLATVASTMDDEWEELIERNNLVHPDEMQTQFTANIENVLDYFYFEVDVLQIQFNLTPLLTDLQSYSFATGINQFMQSPAWEDCTASQNAEYRAFITLESEEFPSCRPDPEVRQAFIQLIQESQEIMIGSIMALPTDDAGNYILDIRYESALDEREGNSLLTEAESYIEADNNFNDMRTGFRFFEKMVPLIFSVPLMLLGLLIMVRVRSSKDFFIWTGMSFAGAGILTGLPVLPLLFNLVQLSEGDVTRVPVTSATANFFNEIESWYISALTPPVMVVAGILLVIGFTEIILGALMRDNSSGADNQPQIVYMVPQNSYAGSSPGPVIQQPGPAPTPAPVQQTPPPASSPPAATTGSTPVTPTGSRYIPADSDDRTFIQNEDATPPPEHSELDGQTFVQSSSQEKRRDKQNKDDQSSDDKPPDKAK